MNEICKYSDECGSCQLLGIAYEKQLLQKTEMVRKECKEFDCEVLETVGLYYPYKYRNKLHLAFARDRGRVAIGFFEEESQNVVDIDECILHDDWAGRLIAILRKYIKLSKIDIFDRESMSGNLRYAVARCIDNSLMLTLVIFGKSINGLQYLYADLCEQFREVGLFINVNTTSSSAVFGNYFVHKFGVKKLEAQMLGVHFQLSPQTFFQVNLNIATKIYKKILSLLGDFTGTILDLYSGIGISSLLLAKNGAKVISIELASDSVVEARRLAKENKLSNITCYCGKCEEVLPTLDLPPATTVFLDPPRKGCMPEVLDKLLEIEPSKIIYLSCSLDSLKRDIQTLSTKYKATYIQPYDMFCQTLHVETLVELDRK